MSGADRRPDLAGLVSLQEPPGSERIFVGGADATTLSETSDVIPHALDYAFLRDQESDEFPEGGCD